MMKFLGMVASVDVDKLLQLSRFLAEVAGQQPQRADGHPAAVR
jgi:hypothetical protein